MKRTSCLKLPVINQACLDTRCLFIYRNYSFHQNTLHFTFMGSPAFPKNKLIFDFHWIVFSWREDPAAHSLPPPESWSSNPLVCLICSHTSLPCFRRQHVHMFSSLLCLPAFCLLVFLLYIYAVRNMTSYYSSHNNRCKHYYKIGSSGWNSKRSV